MNMFTFTVNFCCLLFWAFLSFIYFSKKNMSNIENRVYRNIIILDFMVLIFHLIGLVVAYYIDINPTVMLLIYDINARVYCIAQLVWCILFVYYMIIVINENNKKFNNMLKKSFIGLIITTSFLSLITFILPIDYSYNSSNVLVYNGDRVAFVSIVQIILGIACFTSILLNIKTVNRRKVAPFILFVLLQVSAFVIYLFDSSISIYTLSITLISYLMYHTIENPDIKLINELQLAKIQAEKSNEAKTDFLSSMSHEIRTPLNAIVGLSQIMEYSNDIDEMRSDSKDILLASQNLLEIVNGILDINKIEANKMDIIESDYSPKDIIQICYH